MQDFSWERMRFYPSSGNAWRQTYIHWLVRSLFNHLPDQNTEVFCSVLFCCFFFKKWNWFFVTLINSMIWSVFGSLSCMTCLFLKNSCGMFCDFCQSFGACETIYLQNCCEWIAIVSSRCQVHDRTVVITRASRLRSYIILQWLCF